MRIPFIACLLGIAFLFTAFITQSALPSTAPSSYDLIAAVNELRAGQGLAALNVDGSLMASAQGQSDYLASIGGPNITDGHSGPGGTTPDDRALAAGYPVVQGVDIVECWAWANASVSLNTIIFDIWGDQAHMDVMLHPYGQHVGAGITEKDGNVYYILDVAAIWGTTGQVKSTPSIKLQTKKTTPQVVPVQVATAKPDGSVEHLVQPGQALWSIAIAYGTTVEQLRTLNNLADNAPIYAGETLLIRAPYTPTPTFTATPTSRPPTRTPVPPQPVEDTPQPASNPTTTPFLGNLDRQALGLVLILISGLGLILVLLGTLRREK